MGSFVTEFSPYQGYPGSASEYQDGPPPVLIAVADPAPQRRLTVLVRLILLVPHFIVLYLLLIVAMVTVFLGWWGALFTGRLPVWVGSFLAGYLRWSTRVIAYEFLLADAYPPFSLDDDPAYPVRLALPAPQQLNRAAVFFRLILAFPANIVAGVLILGSGTLMSFIAWLITLVTGQLPASFHGAFTAVVRYELRFYAYWWILTPTYPGALYGDKPGIGTNWTLLLTSGAKKLVTTFIVLGAVFWLADIGLQALAFSKSASNAVVASRAIVALDTSYATLDNQVLAWESAIKACDKNLTCVTAHDAKAATDFSAFASQLQAIRLPPSAVSAAARLDADANATAQDLTVLSQSTTASQYQSAVTSTGLNQTLTRFDADFVALNKELASF
jgi:Domain of unknown function (DUF4389)